MYLHGIASSSVLSALLHFAKNYRHQKYTVFFRHAVAVLFALFMVVYGVLYLSAIFTFQNW